MIMICVLPVRAKEQPVYLSGKIHKNVTAHLSRSVERKVISLKLILYNSIVVTTN